MKFKCKHFEISVRVYGIHGTQYQYELFDMTNDQKSIRNGVGYRTRRDALIAARASRDSIIESRNKKQEK